MNAHFQRQSQHFSSPSTTKAYFSEDFLDSVHEMLETRVNASFFFLCDVQWTQREMHFWKHRVVERHGWHPLFQPRTSCSHVFNPNVLEELCEELHAV